MRNISAKGGKNLNGYRKYHAIKTEVDGIMFDSKKEARKYQELKLLEKAGKIKDLELQKSIKLIPKTQWGREVRYIADFVYIDVEKNERIVMDVKGVRTPVYKLKKRLFEEFYKQRITEV